MRIIALMEVFVKISFAPICDGKLSWTSISKENNFQTSCCALSTLLYSFLQTHIHKFKNIYPFLKYITMYTM
jgi:hypothetical protein